MKYVLLIINIYGFKLKLVSNMHEIMLNCMWFTVCLCSAYALDKCGELLWSYTEMPVYFHSFSFCNLVNRNWSQVADYDYVL